MGAKGPNPSDQPPATPEGTLDAKYDVAQNAKANVLKPKKYCITSSSRMIYD